MDKHEIIKAKRIAKLQGQLKALRHMEQKINDEVLCVFEKLKKDGVEMHPDNFSDPIIPLLTGVNDLANQLVNEKVDVINKIKVWLRGEISDVRSNDYDDIDSRELGILDGRYECAESLLEQIKKWENE